MEVLRVIRLPPPSGRERPRRAEHEADMERTSTTRRLDEDPGTAGTARIEPSRTAHTRRFGSREAGSPRKLVLDRYRLERRLGAGGFGVVWLAFDEKLEREVAVKVVPRE